MDRPDIPEVAMRIQLPDVWVVYQTTLTKSLGQRTLICTQAEWDAMERDHPGHQTLVRGRIANEPEAERLVRSLLPPVAVPDAARRRPRL